MTPPRPLPTCAGRPSTSRCAALQGAANPNTNPNPKQVRARLSKVLRGHFRSDGEDEGHEEGESRLAPEAAPKEVDDPLTAQLVERRA